MNKHIHEFELEKKIRRLSIESIGASPQPEDFSFERNVLSQKVQAKKNIEGISETIPFFTLIILTIGGCAYSGLINSDYSVLDCARSTLISTVVAFGVSALLKAYSNSHYKKLIRYQEAIDDYEHSYQEFKGNHLLSLREHWTNLDGHQFEEEVAKLFRMAGLSVSGTPHSGDYGVDLLIHSEGKTIICQCKAHKNPVGPSIARDLYGALHHFNADSAMLISLSGFTKGVHEFVFGKPIELLSIDELISKYHHVIRDPGITHKPETQLDLWAD